MGEKKTDLDLEWERRTLCSDGSCIGVIGTDGKCKECGKPYEGDLPEVSTFGDDAPDETEDAASETVAEVLEPSESEDTEDSDDEWENRRLCSDGNCIGVIGPDGKCKECGKPFEG
jgi:hypothetical protein